MTMPRAASRLQAELHQKKPFRSPQHEGVVGIVRTADLLRRAVSREVEPHGVSAQQYNVLRILRGAAPESMPTLVIAGRMIERTPGITRLLDRLERKGLVRRERCAADRRQVLCAITPQGLALLDRLDGPVARAEDESLAEISAADLKTVIRVLDAIRDCRA